MKHLVTWSVLFIITQKQVNCTYICNRRLAQKQVYTIYTCWNTCKSFFFFFVKIRIKLKKIKMFFFHIQKWKNIDYYHLVKFIIDWDVNIVIISNQHPNDVLFFYDLLWYTDSCNSNILKSRTYYTKDIYVT